MFAVAFTSNVELIQYLYDTFKVTIDINIQDNEGNTPLMLAVAQNANIEVIGYLCYTFIGQININKQNKQGSTALFLAVKNPNPQIFQFIYTIFEDTIDFSLENDSGVSISRIVD